MHFIFQKVQQLEDRFRRNINKSRPYFEEKQICQDQLETQKERIHELQLHIQCAKKSYATSLKNLEQISEEIHKMRGDLCNAAPSGPREPGVGAELSNIPDKPQKSNCNSSIALAVSPPTSSTTPSPLTINSNVLPILDYASELEKCEIPSLGHTSVTTSSAVSENGDDNSEDDDLDLEELRKKVKVLAVRPVEGGDGQQTQDVWETELNDKINKLDRLMMLRENELNNSASLPSTPVKKSPSPIKMLKKAEPLPSINVSMRELPLLARISNEIAERTQKFSINKRRLSLE